MLRDTLEIVTGVGLPPRVLEINAGRGAYTTGLLDAGQVSRIDLSASAIAFVRRRRLSALNPVDPAK
jgi:hypothetical protein